jgi:DNA-binding YbaB/EbfC family protein
MNMLNMAKKLKDMQGQMKQAKAALAAQTVTGQAGRNAVVIEMNGVMEVKQVTIDAQLLEKQDKPQLEKLVQEALNDALKRVQKVAAAQMGRITGGLGGMSPFG